jgi:hypothetical protein
MGLRSTQGDEKRYRGSHRIVISTGAQRSGEICGFALAFSIITVFDHF